MSASSSPISSPSSGPSSNPSSILSSSPSSSPSRIGTYNGGRRARGLMLKLLPGLLGCTTHVPVMCQDRFRDTVTKLTFNLVIKKWRVAILCLFHFS